MEKSDLLLLLLLNELLPETGTWFEEYVDGNLININLDVIKDLLTDEKIKDRFYTLLLDELEKTINQKYSDEGKEE